MTIALIGNMIANIATLVTATGTRQAFSKSFGVITDTVSIMVVVTDVGEVANQLENI
jgi:hypothetical protein